MGEGQREKEVKRKRKKHFKKRTVKNLWHNHMERKQCSAVMQHSTLDALKQNVPTIFTRLCCKEFFTQRELFMSSESGTSGVGQGKLHWLNVDSYLNRSV